MLISLVFSLKVSLYGMLLLIVPVIVMAYYANLYAKDILLETIENSLANFLYIFFICHFINLFYFLYEVMF